MSIENEELDNANTEVDSVDDGQGEGDESAAQSAEPTYDEVRAKRMGWVPKDQFRGDPEKWVEASEFAKRADESLPLMRSQVKRLEQQLLQQLQQLEQEKQASQKFAKFHEQVEQQAYERAMADLKAQKREARQELDVDKEFEVDEKIEALKSQRQVKPAQQQQQDSDPVVDQWMAENTWAQDEDNYALGVAIGERLRKNGDQSTGREFLDKVKMEMRKKYPSVFGDAPNQNRVTPAPVASTATAQRKVGKTFNDLPADAKAACKDFVKRGYLTEAAYVKQYFGA